MILQKEGYRVLLANDAGQALSVLRDSSVTIHLLILEHASACTTGSGLSDLPTLWPEGRILLVGEDALPNHCELPPQVRGLLSKPFRPELLICAVRGILGGEEDTWNQAADGHRLKSRQEECGQSVIPLETLPADARDLERLVADPGNVANGLTLGEVSWTWKTHRHGGRADRH
jgi:DNA-binding response OmpR family regulator